jgi:hypothetical protein
MAWPNAAKDFTSRWGYSMGYNQIHGKTIENGHL